MSGGSSRSTGIPSELLCWIERFGGARLESGGEALTEAALRALDHAIARPGRERETAFALLAADALMTAAVECLAEADDPEARMRELVERLAIGGGQGEH